MWEGSVVAMGTSSRSNTTDSAASVSKAGERTYPKRSGSVTLRAHEDATHLALHTWLIHH